MQCRRCKTHFDYEKYYGICPGCAYFNRPDGKEEMDFFSEEEDSRFERKEDYRMPELEGSHKELHRQYDVEKEPHKKRKGKRTSWKEVEKRNSRGSRKRWLIIFIIVPVMMLAAVLAFTVDREADIREEAEAETAYAGEGVENFKTGEKILLPDGREVLFENAQTVTGLEITDYLPEGKKLIRIRTFLTATDEYSGEWWFDAPGVKNGELYCYPVDPEVTDDPEKYAGMLEKCMIGMDFLTEEYGDEGYAYLYYVVDEELEKSKLRFTAWEEYRENSMPDYIWNVDFEIEESQDE